MAKCIILQGNSYDNGGVGSEACTAVASEVLAGKTAITKDSNNEPITGTMPNQGAKTASLNCGASYTIPAGYHNGSGKVTANSLTNQTSVTAAAGDIRTGKTAWVNGTKITGNLGTMGGQTATPGQNDITIGCSGKIMTGNIVLKGYGTNKYQMDTVFTDNSCTTSSDGSLNPSINSVSISGNYEYLLFLAEMFTNFGSSRFSRCTAAIFCGPGSYTGTYKVNYFRDQVSVGSSSSNLPSGEFIFYANSANNGSIISAWFGSTTSNNVSTLKVYGFKKI